METGIYVRVSTEEQAREGFSIRAQEEKLRTYADIKDWPLFDVYIDEGISGKNIEARPALMRLLNDIEENRVKNVLVFKVDRLTRSTKNLIELVEFFNEHNCGFNSLTESIDTGSATGRMFLKIIGIFAEFERENLIERVKVGFERKAKEGYSLCSYTASYGYTRPKGQKVQSIVESEAMVVREIFDMFVNQDLALNRIATTLNRNNVPTKLDATWGVKTIRLILENPNYIGKVRYQCQDETKYFEAEGHHQAILDERTFFEAQEKLKRYQKLNRTKRADENVYFSRIAVCEKCGSRLTPKMNYGRKQKDGTRMIYRAYRCINSTKGKCQFSCSHNALESAFESYLEQVFDLEVDADFELNDDVSNEERNKLEIERIEREMQGLEDKQKEISELYLLQQLGFDDYKFTLTMLNEKKQALQIQLATLPDPDVEEKIIINHSDIVRNLKENWSFLNNKEREEFLQRFVEKIVVSAEKKNNRYLDVQIEDVVFRNL